MTRILICGPRDWSDWIFVRNKLNQLLDDYGSLVLIEGGARGADAMAGRWAEDNGGRVIHMRFPAPWKGLGKFAGPIRNKRMLDYGKPDLVVAFQYADRNTPGTQNMLRLAQDAGVETLVVRA